MEGQIGQMAYVGDVWYEILDKRHGVNEMNGKEGIEYKLYTKDYWTPSSWIKNFKDKGKLK